MNTDERVHWWRDEGPSGSPKHILKMGSVDQKILGKANDCDSINWGYAYLAVHPIDANDNLTTSIGGSATTRQQFVNDGTILAQDDERKPR
jgi:hypothetical protein